MTPEYLAGLCAFIIAFLMPVPRSERFERVLHAFEKRLLESTKHGSDDRG